MCGSEYLSLIFLLPALSVLIERLRRRLGVKIEKSKHLFAQREAREAAAHALRQEQHLYRNLDLGRSRIYIDSNDTCAQTRAQAATEGSECSRGGVKHGGIFASSSPASTASPSQASGAMVARRLVLKVLCVVCVASSSYPFVSPPRDAAHSLRTTIYSLAVCMIPLHLPPLQTHACACAYSTQVYQHNENK